MKVRRDQLGDRIAEIGSALRGVERLAPTSDSWNNNPTMDRAIHEAAGNLVQDMLAGRSKYRESEFEFRVPGVMQQVISAWPKEEAKKVWDLGAGHDFQDKLQAELEAQLARHGLAAGKIYYSTDNQDGYLELHVRGLRAGTPEPRLDPAKLTVGPTADLANVALRTRQLLLSSATERLDTATEVLGKYYGADRKGTRSDPKLIHDVTVALEKVVRPLAAVSAAQADSSSQALEEAQRGLQKSYVRLMYALVDAPDVYDNASRADDGIKQGGAKRSVLDWVMGQFSDAKRLLKGEKTGNYERRLQEAMVSLYAHAPVFPGAQAQKLSAPDFVAETFSTATPEMLKNPYQAGLLTKLGVSAELAANAEAAGRFDRAKDAYRQVSFQLLHYFGPSMVTAEAILELGDFEERVGRNDSASRAYVGALRIMKRHLPDNHGLVIETAKKLERTSKAWIGGLDKDPSKPMPLEARDALALTEAARKELGLDAILAQTDSVTTALEKASPEQWTAGLSAAKPNEPFPWEPKSAADRQLYGQVWEVW